MITAAILGLRQITFDMHFHFLLLELVLCELFFGLLQEFLLLDELVLVDATAAPRWHPLAILVRWKASAGFNVQNGLFAYFHLVFQDDIGSRLLLQARFGFPTIDQRRFVIAAVGIARLALGTRIAVLVLQGEISVSQLSFAIAQNRVTLHLAELIVKFLVVGVVSLLFLFALARTRCPLSISTVTFTQEFLHRFPLIFDFTAVA